MSAVICNAWLGPRQPHRRANDRIERASDNSICFYQLYKVSDVDVLLLLFSSSSSCSFSNFDKSNDDVNLIRKLGNVQQQQQQQQQNK